MRECHKTPSSRSFNISQFYHYLYPADISQARFPRKNMYLNPGSKAILIKGNREFNRSLDWYQELLGDELSVGKFQLSVGTISWKRNHVVVKSIFISSTQHEEIQGFYQEKFPKSMKKSSQNPRAERDRQRRMHVSNCSSSSSKPESNSESALLSSFAVDEASSNVA
jgi:hypothetical protein